MQAVAPGNGQHKNISSGIPGPGIPINIKRRVFEDILSSFTPVFAA